MTPIASIVDFFTSGVEVMSAMTPWQEWRLGEFDVNETVPDFIARVRRAAAAEGTPNVQVSGLISAHWEM
jgi:hypothetical protein